MKVARRMRWFKVALGMFLIGVLGGLVFWAGIWEKTGLRGEAAQSLEAGRDGGATRWETGGLTEKLKNVQASLAEKLDHAKAGLTEKLENVLQASLEKLHKRRGFTDEATPGSPSDAKGVRRVRVVPAKMEQWTEIIGANSLVEPVVTLDLKALVSARLLHIKVDVGDILTRGQVFAEFDRTLLQAARETAEAAVQKAKIDLENSKRKLERLTALYAQNLIARVEVEVAEAEVASRHLEVAQANERLKQATLDLTNAQMAAPMTAIVLKRHADPGETVKAGDPLVSLGPLEQVYVVAQVAEEKTGYIRLGQEVEITFDSFPDLVVKGNVSKIDPSTNPKTRTFPTYIKIKNPLLKFKPGLAAYARIKYTQRSLMIPRLAVIQNGGEATVFVVQDSRVHLRAVKVLPGPLGKVQVREGLKEHDEVVYYGLKSLQDKAVVEVEQTEGKELEGISASH